REQGHEVKIHIAQPLCADTLSGLIPHVADWREELGWVKAAGLEGCILFENVSNGRGVLQDSLRRDGFNVIGSSTYGERLETDRALAQSVLGELNLSTASVFEFTNSEDAQRHIETRPSRYVLKFNSPAGATYVGVSADGVDVKAVLSSGNLPASSGL